MEFRVVDFEILTRCFKPYRAGLEEIEHMKADFLAEIEPHRKELNSIISYAQSGLFLDKKTQEETAEKFQKIQSELSEMDSKFKAEIKEFSDKLNLDCYDQLSDIISKWCMENSIDMAMGKMEVVWCKEGLEITGDILECLKLGDLYID